MEQTYAAPRTDPLLRKRDVQAILGISARSLEKLVTQGRITPVIIGARTVRFRPEDVTAFIARSMTEPDP